VGNSFYVAEIGDGRPTAVSEHRLLWLFEPQHLPVKGCSWRGADGQLHMQRWRGGADSVGSAPRTPGREIATPPHQAGSPPLVSCLGRQFLVGNSAPRPPPSAWHSCRGPTERPARKTGLVRTRAPGAGRGAAAPTALAQPKARAAWWCMTDTPWWAHHVGHTILSTPWRAYHGGPTIVGTRRRAHHAVHYMAGTPWRAHHWSSNTPPATPPHQAPGNTW
jgi:hypothetical protein